MTRMDGAQPLSCLTALPEDQQVEAGRGVDGAEGLVPRMLHVLCIRSVYTLLNQDTQSISSEPLSGLNYLRLADVPLALYSVRSGMSALPISNSG